MEIAQVYLGAGDLEADGPETEARRAEAGRQLEKLGNAENESWGVELGYRYDGSPIVWSEPAPPAVDPLRYRASTWPGTRLPNIFLDDGASLHSKLGRYFTLVALDDVDSRALEQVAKSRGVPLAVLRLERTNLRPIFERDLLLVRPDQHVAWRGDALPENLDELLAKVIGI